MSDPAVQPVFRPLSKHFWIVLSVGVLVVLAVFGTYVVSTDCNGVKQAINMRKARRHIEAISPSVMSVHGREHVEMTEYTAGPCGCLLVRGRVASVGEAETLRAEIAASMPPVAVLFQLSAGESESSPMVPLDLIPAFKPASKPVSK